MKEIRPSLLHCQLYKLVIPGTHDSGTYGIKNDNRYTPSKVWPSKWCWWAHTFWSKEKIAGSCKAQGKSIGIQLSLGIRYIDLRLIRIGEKKFSTFHGMKYGANLDEILDEIDAFIKGHKKEIIIIGLNAFEGFNNNTQLKELEQSFKDKFQDKIATNDFTPANTFDYFWRHGKQIILIWDYRQIKIKDFYSKMFWSNMMIESIYAHGDATPKNFSDRLKTDILNEKRSPHKLFNIQGVVPVNRTNKWDLHDIAVNVMPKLKDLIEKVWSDSHTLVSEKHKLNIITADFFDEFQDFINQLIMYNAQR